LRYHQLIVTRLGIALLFAVLSGCGSDPTQLIVVVDSDLMVPLELDEVRIEVVGPMAEPTEVTQSLTGTDAPVLPLTLTLVPAGEELGPVTVTARGLVTGGEVISRTARTTLVKGESRVLRLFLLRSCIGTGCPTDQSCGEDGCANIDIPFAELPEWTGRPPRIDSGLERMDGGRDGGRDAGRDGGPDSGPVDAGCTSDMQCSDGVFCNGPETCVAGACAPGTPPVCDDGVACTNDSCDEGAGACANAPDNSLCTVVSGGTCDRTGGCQYPVCNAMTCVAGGCQSAVCMGTTCVRTSMCARDEMCCAGSCVPTGCDDRNPCTDDSCGGSGCVYANNTNPCSDGSMCTASDRCSGGTCVPGSALGCNDGNPCTDDSCNAATGCVNTNNTATCNDGNACTTGDRCSGGSCSGSTRSCNDSNACTDDSCDSGSGCVFTNNAAACSDGNACTTGDRCSGGSCSGPGSLSCNDGNLCTDDSCNPASGCVFTNNSVSCNDSNMCTTSDRCSGGSCSGTTVTCNDGNVCTNDSCNPASGCVYTNNTASCNDGNACTTGERCSGGVCSGGMTTVCNDSNDCTSDTCNMGGCTYTPLASGTPCGSATSDPCNAPDTCNGMGTCLANLRPPTTTCSCASSPLCRAACPVFPGADCDYDGWNYHCAPNCAAAGLSECSAPRPPYCP